MVSTPATTDPSLPPPPITVGGTYSIQQVSVGCKIYIRRPTSDGQTEERLAEILSIRDKASSPYTSRRSSVKPSPAEDDATPTPKPEDHYEFFVHWDAFNKRLDEWVSGSRLVLSRDLEWPRPKPPPVVKKLTGAAAMKAPGKVPKSKNLLKKATSNAAAVSKGGKPPLTPVSAAATPPPQFTALSPSPTPSLPPSLKRKVPHDEEDILERLPQTPQTPQPFDDDDEDAEGDMDVDAEEEMNQLRALEADANDLSTDLSTVNATEAPLPQIFSKEQEIEKLRTSGSMTQSISEIARVKNLNRLQIGKHEVEAWYFSPYPKEYAHLPVLYICEFCLSFYPSAFMLSRHRRRCNLLHPPGNEIYRHEDISFFEIDGRRQVAWCRNLSLLSKCFLDHKTLYYDVTPFLYYVMTQRDSTGCHIIGYFSKEKESAENYNVACILTLPQHQRHGFGRTLIEFSYELTKKEGKLGSPEKPLSDLGLLGYRAYWQEKIIELLVNADENDELSIDDIAQRTAITHADVLNTCTTLQLFKHYKGQHLICLNKAALEKYEKARAKRKRRIVSEKLIWKPPVFTRDQLRFGW